MKNSTLLLFMFCAVSLYAQSYPKYSTKKVKDTVFVNESKVAENASKDKAAVEGDMPPEFMKLIEEGRKFYKEGKFDEAIKAFSDAFPLSPVKAKYWVIHLRAGCYLAKGDYDKAIQDCTVIIEKAIVPHKNALGQAHLLRALALRKRNKPGDDEVACADVKKVKESEVVKGPFFDECLE